MINIGDNIKALRTKKGITQTRLAELLGVSRSAVSSWEVNRNEPNIGDIEKMASIFQCLKTDIIGRDKVDYYIVDDSEEKQLLDMYRKLPADIKLLCSRELSYYYAITQNFDVSPEVVPLKSFLHMSFSEDGKPIFQNDHKSPKEKKEG